MAVKLKEEDKQFLLGLTNLASKQFGDGIDTTSLINYCTSYSKPEPLTPSSDLLQNGQMPSLPKGINMLSLPLISEASGGIFGFWAIGGEAGVGKSTLAWQIALSVGQKIPVLIYDLENGTQNLLYRTACIFDRNISRMRSALSKVYLRESISSLETDLLQIQAPALIVVDSLQKLPVTIAQRRGSLDKWIHRLENLTKTGYSVLIVSEKNRAGYGQANMGGFKETGEIEYSASFGAILLQREDSEDLGFYVVKNRHRGKKGFICTLVRDKDKTFWYDEV